MRCRNDRQERGMSKVLAFRRGRPQVQAENKVKALDATSTDTQAAGTSKCVLLRAARREREDTQAAAGLLVSVVVPARGRAELLNRCIAGLMLQSFDPMRYEIIIVDDGSPRLAREVQAVIARWTRPSEAGVPQGPRIIHLSAASRSMNLHCADHCADHRANSWSDQSEHVQHANRSAAAARNCGWRAARADIIAFTEEDTVARADWLANGLAALQSKKVDATWGKVVVPSALPQQSEADPISQMATREAACLAAANCFCRKDVLENLNGFDEAFDIASCEAADLYLRLISIHARVVHEPRAIVNRPRRPSAGGLDLLQVKRVQYDALLYKKHPQLYREKIRSRPRRDFYLMTLSLPLAIAGLAFNLPALALPFGLLWLMLAGRFSRQRLRQQPHTIGRITETVVSAVLLPPVSVFWRLAGAWRYRVGFL